jgi:organic radical activating enzyme
MNKINDTVSLCEVCYRHIPAVTFERDGAVWIEKFCPKHGRSEHLVDPDSEFYLNFSYPRTSLESYFLEVTNRCNLTCPHCYQVPDNKEKDLPIEYFIEKISSYSNDGYCISLAGAEPTLRKDLELLIKEIKNIPGKDRSIIVLTNGVRLSNYDYAKKFIDLNDTHWTIGLNHPDYQGHSVRKKQLQGIINSVNLGLNIKNISYTLEGFHQLEYCLDEIQDFSLKFCKKFRIRVSSDIGRTPAEEETLYLSQLVNEVKKISARKNWSFEVDHFSGNRSHYSVYINGVHIKLIQWPDVKTIDLEEKQTETWADFLPNKPISPLIHQALLRDASINKKIMLFDTIPKKYQR